MDRKNLEVRKREVDGSHVRRQMFRYTVEVNRKFESDKTLRKGGREDGFLSIREKDKCIVELYGETTVNSVTYLNK